MQTSTVLSATNDVSAALARLEVPLDLLQAAVQAGYAASSTRTMHDSRGAAGFYMWNEVVRKLRESLAFRGWKPDDYGNLPTSVRPDLQFAICVQSGDESTGLIGSSPTSKRIRGPMTESAVLINAGYVLWLPGLEPAAKAESEQPCAYPTWILLFCVTQHELRSELSLPIGFTAGKVDRWQERILLPPIATDPSLPIPTPDFGPDIDFNITRLV